MVVMSSSDDYGISETDREKFKYLSENGAPGGGATLDDILDTGDGSDGSKPGKTETRERVLTGPEFERLLIGALRIDDDETAFTTWASLVIIGRLGFRAGEFIHFSMDWYNDREQIISIPKHDTCTSGRGGGICGHCKQAARQRQDHGDERDIEEIQADYWQPKTEAAVRDVPTGWSARVEEAVLLLGQLHGEYPHAYSTLKRYLNTAIDNAPMLDENATTLHGLRGTAASYHAGNGVDKEALKQMMGWRDDKTPMKYLSINGNMASRALGKVYR